MHANARESEIVDDASPLDFWTTKVDEQCQMETRCLEVVDALRKVLVRVALDALVFHEQAIFHH